MFLAVVLAMAVFCATACRTEKSRKEGNKAIIVTSDTLLSGMIGTLLPPDKSVVSALMPPNQCPGHYDIKLSDIRKVKSADLVVAFRDMPFMNEAEIDPGKLLLLDTEGRNWMAPDAYHIGLRLLAEELSRRFPEDSQHIERMRDKATGEIARQAELLHEKLDRAGMAAQPVIAASMQKQSLEWMGFLVAGEYGRPESMSAREIVRLSRIGRDKRVLMVVDNLQSGPEAGKGIAEELGVPHVILSNFPLEKGYVATLNENIDAVLAAARKKE